MLYYYKTNDNEGESSPFGDIAIEKGVCMEAEILLWIQDYLRTPVLDSLMCGITHLGDFGIFWILMAVVLLLYPDTRKTGVAVTAGMLVSFVFNNLLLKNLVARTRPYEVIDGLTLIVDKASDLSFPSGHSATSFVAAAVMMCLLPRRYGVSAMILAALIACSRLYVGIHYPTDVLFGAVSGILIGFVTAAVSRQILLKGVET